ncbi:UNVERIFIED_CONTAM: putative pyrroloquinoline-quinone binding quinoprotein [Acetivibrio alkalicellulosi]
MKRKVLQFIILIILVGAIIYISNWYFNRKSILESINIAIEDVKSIWLKDTVKLNYDEDILRIVNEFNSLTIMPLDQVNIELTPMGTEWLIELNNGDVYKYITISESDFAYVKKNDKSIYVLKSQELDGFRDDVMNKKNKIHKEEGLNWYISAYELSDRYNLNLVENLETTVLKVTPPIEEIKTESDLFYVWSESDKLHGWISLYIVDENSRKWGIGEAGYIQEGIEIKENEKIYYFRWDEKIEITNYFNKLEFNIKDIDITPLRPEFLFRVSDGKKEGTIILKDNKMIFLNEFQIEALDYISYDYSCAFIAKNNNSHYVYRNNEKKLVRYKLPDEIEEIVDIYYTISWDLCEDLKEDVVYLLIAHKKGEKNKSYYRINLSKKEITEFLTLKKFTELFSLNWCFQGDVVSNRFDNRVDDVIIVKGTDERLSGHHDHDFLYGINRLTGEKIWSFYGGYEGTPYDISEDEKFVYALNSITGILSCIEIKTGNVVWDKSINDNFETGNYKGVISAKDYVVITGYGKTVAYCVYKRDLVWEKDYYNGFSEIYKYKDLLVFSNGEGIKSINFFTGNTVWEVKESGRRLYECTFKDNLIYADFNETIKAINMDSGKIVYTLSNESKYMVIFDVVSKEDYFSDIAIIYNEYQNSLIESNLKCIDKNENILWEMLYKGYIFPHRGYAYPVRINNKLFIRMKESMVAIDVKSQKILYQISDYPIQNSVPQIFEDGVYWFIRKYNGQLHCFKIDI